MDIPIDLWNVIEIIGDNKASPITEHQTEKLPKYESMWKESKTQEMNKKIEMNIIWKR